MDEFHEGSAPAAAAGAPQGDVSAAVVALGAAVRALVEEGVLPVGLDAGDRPADDVHALLVALAQVEAVLAMRMATAEAGGALPLLSAGGMASHLSWSRGRARALSRAGHLANEHHELAQRWLAGAITAEHVDAAARGVGGLPPDRARAVIEGLTPALGQVTPKAISAYCARARAIVDPMPPDPEQAARKAHAERFLSFSVLDDTVHITGALARLDGELLMATIHARAEQLRVAGDGVTAAQRRADALTLLAAAPGAAGSGPWPAAPVSITLTTELEATTGDGFPLPAPDTRFLLCDASITPVVTTGSGVQRRSDHGSGPPRCSRPHADLPAERDRHREHLAALTARALEAPQPLAVGRAHRVATPAQRRALAVRDRGCILPGCEVPAAQCQVHHLVPWTQGGATDLPNLVTLCWAHHRQVDLGRWDIHPLSAGQAGTPANHGAPFTVTLRRRRRWGEALAS